MEALGQIYTSGIFITKPGNEEEFIRAWEVFAQWTSEKLAGAGVGHLLQDLEHPNRFLSIGPWESTDRIKEWRSQPEFAAFIAKARELCEEVKPSTLNLVAYVASPANP